MGRDKLFPAEYTDEIDSNCDRLLEAFNKVRTAYGKSMTVASGFRPPSVNAGTANAAPNSAHCISLAIDIRDTSGELWKWTVANLQLMKDLGFFLEDRRYTPSWVHYQLIKPTSGKRIFIPSKGLPPAPTIFDGRYDSKYDEKAKK